MHAHTLFSADDLLPYVPFAIATGDVVKVVYNYYLCKPRSSISCASDHTCYIILCDGTE